MMPGMSPYPSPSWSRQDRTYSWYSTAPCHHGVAAICVSLPPLLSLTPDSRTRLGIEELHALGVDGEGDPVAGLGRRACLDARHALARDGGRVGILVHGALGAYPLGIDREVDYQLRAECLDQVDVAGEARASRRRGGGRQVLGPQAHDDVPAGIG